jgi:DNA polymerase-3 subunit alpha
MYLFFNTKTTGFPGDYNAPLTDTSNWPRLVQLAYALYTAEGRMMETYNRIIRPEGYEIPYDAEALHGISTEKALREGEDLGRVLDDFHRITFRCTHLIGHNVSFNEKIIGAEFFRKKGSNPLTIHSKHCLMKKAEIVEFCALQPFMYGTFKWPTLPELHSKLFGMPYKETNDAARDLDVMVKCFLELLRKGII